ncbi:MAG: PAS domain-containing sensor histidine kinase [Pseudomonadota bacterium]
MGLRYQEYFESSPCYLTVQDHDLRIVAANKRFREHFGASEGHFCYQIYKQRAEKCEKCPASRTLRDGESHTSEEQVKNINGQEVSVIVYTTPIFNVDGRVEAVMKMSTDITEIKLLEKQLRENQERYRLIFDEVPCYISIQDKDLNILDANGRFKKAFGTSLGRKCYQIYKHRDEECTRCAVKETFFDGAVHSSEEVVTSLDGRQVNTLVYTAPIRDPSGEIQSVMEMSTDITSIRELQSQLESVGMLISTISHGIKGLLTGLDGGRYLVNTGLQKGKQDRVQQGWEMVQRNVDRIRDMVLNILYYAKEREPNFERVSVHELAKDVLSIVEPRGKEHGIELRNETDESAGDFEADALAIRSLLINLLENSLDACRVDTKKKHHSVSFGIRVDLDSVQFEIQDNGIGMDRETKENAFNLFFSAKGVEGTGLGLFISNRIAKAHGGSIKVESELGKGSRFVVDFPRKQVVR